jgi:hypothetical protein
MTAARKTETFFEKPCIGVTWTISVRSRYMKSLSRPITFSLLAIIAASCCLAPAEARSFRAYGPRGAIGANARAYTNANGGTWGRAGAGAFGPNAGLGGGGFAGSGPNGSGSGGGVAGYKRGVGAFEGTQMNLKGANGSSYNGYTKGKYNAQTGQGAYNASHQGYDAQNGKTYGDTNNTSFTKGQGGTTQLDTDNHGDYTANWGAGQKPVITKDPSQ